MAFDYCSCYGNRSTLIKKFVQRCQRHYQNIIDELINNKKTEKQPRTIDNDAN